MKIIGNIIPGIKLLTSLNGTGPYRKKIDRAVREGNPEEERENIRKGLAMWGEKVCPMLGIDVEVIGEENIPTHGPVVFVSNHQSYADIFVCAKVLSKIQFGFIAKEELLKLPVYGKWMTRIRSVTLDRGNVRETLQKFNETAEMIKSGYSMLIFPEGTRSQGEKMAHFKQGSLSLATRAGVPVIPVTIDGTYKVFEETGTFKPAKVRMTVHEAIETKDMPRKETKELSERVEAIVRSAL